MFHKISRRHFVKLSLLTTISLGLSGCTLDDNEPEQGARGTGSSTEEAASLVQDSEPHRGHTADVLIVGAGMAGLGAAQALHADGYRVIILEARDRIGGRVWTDHTWPNSPLDMGASWIHGVRNNPITALARRFNVRTVETDYDSHLVYDGHGRRLSDAEQEEIEEIFEELLAELAALGEELDDDISIQAAFDQLLAGESLSRQEQQKLNFAINTIIEHEYAADIGDLSLWYTDEGQAFGGEDVLFPGGYGQIAQGLAAGLDVRLNHTVQQISYGRDGVTITTNQAVFKSDQAVVTLPLGVLKSGSVQFSPPLPQRKMTAVRNMGMGLLNKVYLRFPAVFWDKAPDLLGYMGDNKGEWAEWLNINKVTGQPVLLCFNAGNYGRQLESFTDEKIVAEAMTVLRTMYGTAVPNPEAWLITRWASDPLAGGSYSYLPPGATPDDYDALAAPVDGRLFFAGEATSRDHAATVHGAFLSGEREARRISELTKASGMRIL